MRSKGNKLMALFVAFSCLATASAIRAQEDRRVPPSKDLCYAFLRDHDIWTVCQGKRERIHMPYKVSGEILEGDDSFDPQWITPRIAERLHQWGSSLASSAPQ